MICEPTYVVCPSPGPFQIHPEAVHPPKLALVLMAAYVLQVVISVHRHARR